MRRFPVVLAILVLAGPGTGFTGCDPTEDTFAVRLLNDTQRAVFAYQCGNGCGSAPTEKDKLAPGQSVAVNTSSSDVDNWWQIRSSSGAVVGCLDLLYAHKEPHALRRLSALARCPRS